MSGRRLAIHASAIVDATARIGECVIIGPYVFIGKNVCIGANTVIESHVHVGDHVALGESCVLFDHVSVHNCTSGDRLVLKPGSRIGQDGFGFHPAGTNDPTKVVKKPQLLNVIVGHDVEIGANCTVDRGSWRDTTIGNHTKIDNLCQIGHNVQIGENCLIAAQTGIAGSVMIGNRVLIGGQTGIAQYVKIGDDCQIAAKSGVIKDLPPKSKVGGVPAVDIYRFHRTFLETFPRAKRSS